MGNVSLFVCGGSKYGKLDEIYVWDENCDAVKVSLDKMGDSNPIRCAHCNEPAIILDGFFPYYMENNRCANCAWAESIISREERDKRMALINAVLEV